jgi:hypothetical protein
MFIKQTTSILIIEHGSTISSQIKRGEEDV